MIFESTGRALRNMVVSLENDREARWDDYLESGKQCMYELHQMSRPQLRAHQGIRGIAVALERSSRAIPHVKSMNIAIRKGDRNAAIESGKAAVAEMNGLPRKSPGGAGGAPANSC